ncbi:MAG TPA: carbohydrate ABC transporter permease [Trebonia sp.]|jgi:multiple sugar transport system permease protein|nr:carbohydrate ABC transporter permease [Trebonia sp.]
MSAPPLSAPPPARPRAQTRRERRRRERLERQDAAIPVELYGLRRGTLTALTACCVLFAVFILAPVVWVIINSTKTQANIFESFGFWFAAPFEFFHTFANLFRDVDGDGTYSQWFLNTVLYSVSGGIGATVLAALGGYGFARFEFRGSKVFFAVIIAGLLVPITLIAVPLYLAYAKVHLINSIWGMILPSMVSPVGLYLMRTYVELSIPRELTDAARIDGASEPRIFFRIALPLMVPGVMTVLLLSVAGTWNNYILPLIIFSDNNLYPVTVGMGLWSQHASNSGDANLYPLIVMGGLVTIIPMIALFALLQRYWRGGLLLGSVAN